MEHALITLSEAHPDDYASFKKELQEAFAVAVVDEFGNLPDGPIPSDEVLRGGSGNLNRCGKWSFCLTATKMVAEQERR